MKTCLKHSIYVVCVMMAALCSAPSWASLEVRYEAKSNLVIVESLTTDEIDYAIDEASNIYLQTTSNVDLGSIAVSATRHEDTLLIKPLFPLLADQYVVSLKLNSNITRADYFSVQPTSKNGAVPKVVKVTPTSGVIPSNALRLYLHFNEPMARGQVKSFIHFYDESGQQDPYAFLNTNVELWDRTQSRLTLLFDPGRVKADVGPNQAIGAPLAGTKHFEIRISAGIKSARGIASSASQYFEFAVINAERRKLSTEEINVSLPKPNSNDALSLRFDRVMDADNAKRNIVITNNQGDLVEGDIRYEQSWQFIPFKPWKKNDYQIVIHRSLEDIAGNRFNAAFDSVNGSLNRDPNVIVIPFSLLP